MMINLFGMYAARISIFLADKTGDQCAKGHILTLKPWYAYLGFDDSCNVIGNLQQSPAEIWLVAAAIFEDLLQIAALVAIGFVIAGGYKMMISQGEPQNFAAGRKMVINALIGMAIAIVASQIVGFLAGRFSV